MKLSSGRDSRRRTEPPARSQPYLEISSFLWEKESHGLFDYESKKLSKKVFKVRGSCRVLRTEDGVALEPMLEPAPPEPSRKHLFNIFVEEFNRENVFYMMPAQEEVPESEALTPYLVVRSLKSRSLNQKGYPLQAGDIIKLGRIKYLVHEYRDNSKTHSLGKIMLFGSQVSETYNATFRPGDGICKICFDVQTEDNMFIEPCRCKGSCSFVHVSCLKKWIESKISKHPNNCSTMYNLSKFECEICQHPYPYKVVLNGAEIPMIEIEKPKKPYILLQSLNEGRQDEERMLFLVKLPDTYLKIFKLGRAQTSEIRMTDISVSRSHAYIRYFNKQFHLFDNTSKFGTLVKMKGSIVFGYDMVAVQIGRTVLTMTMRNPPLDEDTESAGN
jgi:hypothetical protein